MDNLDAEMDAWDRLSDEVLVQHESLYRKMVGAMSCGNCCCLTSADSDYCCKVCGRVLCVECGIRWQVCQDHVPTCSHPELVPTYWNQPKPEPCKVVGRSRHNYVCPVCGFGVGCCPDPSDRVIAKVKGEDNGQD